MPITTKKTITRALCFILPFAVAPIGCSEIDPLEQDVLELDEEGMTESAEQALSVYETEPNNTPSSAKAIKMRDDNHGAFPSGDTVDYWKFNLPARMYVNIFLGNIPAGSDYDIQVFKSTDVSSPVWSGTKGSNADELVVSRDMQAGDYIVKVYPYGGPRGDVQYRLRYAPTAISRGWEWVDVQMPYCGGVNGGADLLCGGTCVRTGSAANPLWDPYRSDCSGFVSWAWQLAAPGLTTSTLPNASTTITGSNLAPGDILLGNGHVVLFESWTDKAAGKARILHEPTCDTVAKAETVTLTASSSSSNVQLWGANYNAYRRNMP
ncbi:pre-peptidase C-terminal domain-containing protein [Sorangium sp. So ce1389]|uniref:pre-peptidase C-terminal domain-containing protein n=1 Tax=Sorangium sp. So ce1389 TaxID=3133336 RepID=UPI003F5E4FEE